MERKYGQLPGLVLNEIVRHTSASPITAKEIAESLDADESQIRAIVHKLRADMVPICSSKRGYYLSTELVEVRRTMYSLEDRIKKQLEAIAGLKAYIQLAGGG